MNIGILGGTFDPIHNGHLAIAEEVKAQQNLSVTLFIPAGQPWLKIDVSISPAEHRVQMVRLAITDRPDFKLSTIDIDRAGPSYSVDTIAEVRKQLGDGDELYFILGWDSIADLHKWKEPSRLIEMCYLVVVPRPGYPRPEIKTLEAALPGISRRVIFLEQPYIDISATAIRDRVARGLSIRHLVPQPVNKYIKEHRLYVAR